MQVYPLSEGSFTIDGTKVFVPFNPLTDQLQDRPRGSLLVEIQPFVVITGNETILLDTGLGYSGHGGHLQIYQNLEHVGIKPTDITMVLLSHLHRDHAGGISHVDPQSGKRLPVFPQAKYYVQKKEFEWACTDGGASYDASSFDMLSSSDQLQLLEGDGNIGEVVEYRLSGGHCPFHQVFWIREGGQTIFFGGDEAPQLQQMRHSFIAKYDHDGRKAMEMRKTWWKQGASDGWKFLFYHDIKAPIVIPDVP